jgi:hypothetical protein
MPQFFRHYKNKAYKVLGIAKHSETLEELVVYETLYENPLGKLWVRPKEMFFESIVHNGKLIPRFAPVVPRYEVRFSVGEKDLVEMKILAAKVFPEFSPSKMDQKLATAKNIRLDLAYQDEILVGLKIGFEESAKIYYSWLGGVDPQWQGRGIGQELMRRQHEWCRGQGYGVIRTKTQNRWPAMLVLNVRNGFQITGIEKCEDEADKLLLEKPLI